MRKTKFRAWDKDGKEMFRVVMIAWKPDGSSILSGRGGSIGSKYVKIMQSTGLKDCRGKEIFEGDILEEEPGYRFSVVWDKEYAKFKLQWLTKAVQYPEWNRGREMIIVGNIYQHPELLKS